MGEESKAYNNSKKLSNSGSGDYNTQTVVRVISFTCGMPLYKRTPVRVRMSYTGWANKKQAKFETPPFQKF